MEGSRRGLGDPLARGSRAGGSRRGPLAAAGLVFSHGFFERWGWLVGPLTWMLCAYVTARIVGLPEAPVLVRAVLAGLLSALFVLGGLHWLGAAVAIAVLAAWCAYLPRPA
jgi:hypothetical protein